MKIRQVNKKKRKWNGIHIKFFKNITFQIKRERYMKNMKIKPDTGLNIVDYRQIVFIRNQVTFQR